MYEHTNTSSQIPHQNNMVYCNLTKNTIIRINRHDHLIQYSKSMYKRKWGPAWPHHATLSSWHSKNVLSQLDWTAAIQPGLGPLLRYKVKL